MRLTTKYWTAIVICFPVVFWTRISVTREGETERERERERDGGGGGGGREGGPTSPALQMYRGVSESTRLAAVCLPRYFALICYC